MKHASITTLVTFAMSALVTVATAQMSPDATMQSPATAPGSSEVAPATPRPEAPPADNTTGAVQTDSRNDDVAALPRDAVERRPTIFGLPPAAAIIIGSALLLIVVLSIMALFRGPRDTYVGPHRRI